MEHLTRSFKTFLAKKTIEVLSGNTSNFFTFAAKAEDNIDAPVETLSTTYDLKYKIDREIIFGKKILSSDISLMIKNIPWVSNTIYVAYDDQIENLENSNFYVVVDETDGTKSVFKCLQSAKKYTQDLNFILQPAFDKPSKTRMIDLTSSYMTADGYEWKYLYNIPAASVNKFATNEYIPVINETLISNSAIAGSIDSIVVNYSGSQYNKYASVKIKDVAVGGDSKLHNIVAENTITVYSVNVSSNTTYIPIAPIEILDIDDNVLVEGSVYSFEGLNLKITLNNELLLETLSFFKIRQGSIVNTFTSVDKLIYPNLSFNSGDYGGNSLYIRGGTGAGQLRHITKYTVANNVFQIELDAPFTTIPTNTSTIEILPRVNLTGNGNNFKAIPIIDTSANSIIGIQVLDSGSGYTYANASISGNTGYIDISTGQSISANPAEIRPIISPLGGHGFNNEIELFVNAVCVSTKFDNSLPYNNGYNKIGILAGVNLYNAANTFDDRTELDINIVYNGILDNGFIVGEKITQLSTNATALIHEIANTSLKINEVIGNFSNTSLLYIEGAESKAKAQINNIELPNRIPLVCETFYVKDLTNQIDRNIDQTEDIKIIINF